MIYLFAGTSDVARCDRLSTHVPPASQTNDVNQYPSSPGEVTRHRFGIDVDRVRKLPIVFCGRRETTAYFIFEIMSLRPYSNIKIRLETKLKLWN